MVQEVEAFAPIREEGESAAELAAPSPPPRLRLQLATSVPAAFLDELREVVGHFPGRHELVLEVGGRTLVLGPDFRVTDSSAFRADVVTLAGGGLSVA